MKKQDLTLLDSKELTQKEKTLKKGLGVFIGVLTVLAVAILILFVRKQFSMVAPLVAVLLGLLSILLVNRKTLADIKKELETRGK